MKHLLTLTTLLLAAGHAFAQPPDRVLANLEGASGTPLPMQVKAITQTVRIESDFIQLPLLQRADARKPGAERFEIRADGKVLRYVHLQFAGKDQKPDFIYSYDVREFRGREVTLCFKSSDAGVLARLELNNKEISDPQAYEGPHRPRFHFSPRLGWMNDINGSYYQNGLYHIFYQANPTCAGASCGFDMHWGHSVSKDLVHWKEWPIALFPNAYDQCYSGSTVMQQQPITGLNEGVMLPAPVLAFTATGPHGQHLATSPDGGRTWQRFAGNPVVPRIGDADRDPKVFWHEATKSYVMILYVGGKGYVFLRSTDLQKWKRTCERPYWYECPEFFPMKSPTTGEDLWVLYGNYNPPKEVPGKIRASSAYQLGRFDGTTFTPVTEVRRAHLGPNFYAALTFVNEPKGRPVMMGWTRGTRFPGEPFNQCASLPLQLSLKAFNGQDTLCFEPVQEVNALRGRPLVQLVNVSPASVIEKCKTLEKETPLDVTLSLRPNEKQIVKIVVRGLQFTYSTATGKLTCSNNGRQISETEIHPDGPVAARFMIDRGIVEAFWNGGEAAFSISSLHTDNGPTFAIEGNTTIEDLQIFSMNNIWDK